MDLQRHHQLLEQQRLELQRETHALEPGETPGTNAKYKQLISKYKKFVDAADSQGDKRFGLEDGMYINDIAVMQYYLQVESKRKATAKTARSTLLALNQLCTQEGHSSLEESGAWATIQTVFSSLDKNSERRAKGKVVDIADSNPTKIISNEELSKIMFQDLNQCNGKWQEVSLVWVILSATLVRWFSGSLLTLEHLYVYKELPPGGTKTPHDLCEWDDHDDTGWVMSFLIPPNLQIKKNNKVSQRKTELVGAYRHKRAERCCAGVLAFNIFEKANSSRFKVSFLKNPPAGYMSWRNVKLFPKAYSTTYDNMKDSMTKAEVPQWLKVTHLRKFGIAFLTAQGLTENEVTTMTKHRDNNFTRSYRAEMCVKIASTLAGFLPCHATSTDNNYFVPRANLKLPNNLDADPLKFDQLTNHLFPPLQQWKQELASPEGDRDHQESATHFLNVVIPWFTKILLQDAVIWMKEFPNNSAKTLLLHKLTVDRRGVELLGEQNYSQWAMGARKEIKQMISDRQISDEAKQMSSERLIQLLIKQQSQIDNLQQQIVEYGLERNIKHREVLDAISKQTNVYTAAAAAVPQLFRGPHQTTTTTAIPEVQHHDHQSNTQRTVPPCTTTETQQQLRTIDQALNHGNDPIIPTIWQINKYETVENLSSLGVLHHHTCVTTALLRKTGPLYAKKDHWVKIARIRKRLKDYMSEKNIGDELEAAKEIDSMERQDLSLNQYAEFLRTNQVFHGKYSGKRKRG